MEYSETALTAVPEPRGEPGSPPAIKRKLTPARRKETPEYLGFVRRAIRAAARRIADEADPAALADLSALSAEIDAAIKLAVAGLRAQHGYSWSEIGAALGITPQGAHQRYRDQAAEVAAFHRALAELHLRAGQPGSRVIAAGVRAAGGQISHTTVSVALRGRGMPTWPATEAIAAYLGGDVEEFQRLWMEANRV